MLRSTTRLLPLFLLVAAPPARGQVPSAREQIEGALTVAPAGLRDGATVLGRGGEARDGDVLTTIRPGVNELICLADDPEEEGFHVSCYHRDLDGFMALGRRLRAEGADAERVLEARYAAFEAGEFQMPTAAALYSLWADRAPGAGAPVPEGARRLDVVYLPFATAEATGLPTRPEGDAPWLMLPGTPWAHIMISR